MTIFYSRPVQSMAAQVALLTVAQLRLLAKVDEVVAELDAGMAASDAAAALKVAAQEAREVRP